MEIRNKILPVLLMSFSINFAAYAQLADGLIIQWSGTLASIPANWDLCDGTSGTPDLRGRFLKGAPAATNAGATGGSSGSHDHGGSVSTFTGASSTLSVRHGTGNCGIGCATWGYNSPGQGHTHNYDHNHTLSSEANIEPPYYEIAYLQSNGACEIPSGGITMWHGTLASIPSGWDLCDGTSGTPDLRDRFVKGAPAATNPGSTGGSQTHNHGGTSGSDPGGTTTTNGATNGTAGGTARMAVHNHSVPGHSHTIPSINHEPVYYQVAFIQKQ